MLKLISIGIYYMSVAVLVLGVLGSLSFIQFPPISAIILYLLFGEIASLVMAVVIKDEE